MARITVKPVEFLELEFNDGTVKRALFNNEAFIYYSNEFGELDTDEIKRKPYDCIAKILYCGIKVTDKAITLDEAMSIIAGGGEELMQEITRLLIDNFMAVSDETGKKKLTKEIKKIMKQIQTE